MALVDVRGFQFQDDPNRLSRGISQLQAFQQLGQQNIQADKSAQVRQLLGQTGQVAPQTQQQQQLAAQTAELGGPQALAEQPRAKRSQEELIQLAREIDPVVAEKNLQAIGLDTASKRAEMSRFAGSIQGLSHEQQGDAINARAQKLQAEGRDPSETLKLLDLDPTARDQALTGVQLFDLSTKERFAVRGRATRGAEVPAGQREFESLTKELTKDEKREATLIKLGLSPRAVGSAIQTISDEGIAEEIGKASATIAQRKKFGEMTGSSRAKAIDKGFEKIVKIDLGIRNLDRAIKALDDGASTGVMQTFSPSVRASSVALDQVKNTLALDVLNSATFGALSEKELELVKETALPTKLSPPELRQWILDRKEAETKLKAYFQEQINFLDQGGTIAGFLREKEREQETLPEQDGVKFLGFE